MKEKILIAMSGGVDSSVAATLMLEAGYDCCGVTMQLLPAEGADLGGCGSKQEAMVAAEVAARIGIPHEIVNFTGDFKKHVIDRFIKTYEEGGTPNPCIECNRHLKFSALLQQGKATGCQGIATGHYARVCREQGRYLLKKAKNPQKDQSYVLYSLTQEQLAMTHFPLGELGKDEVRSIAEAKGFSNAHKPDSQDICFVPDGDYAAVIRRYSGREYAPGAFVDQAGNVLGTHKGIIHYTIGQRKGLGLSFSEPRYVCRKDVCRNEVVLCKNEELFSKRLRAVDVNWILFDTPPAELRAKARIRYQQAEQWATIVPDGKDSFLLEFDEPQRAISPGQAVVLYQDEYVVGGGTITLCES